ncbi:7-alpha-hydroxycholest-4-en-3-one 12-alpha-hydroxylase-like [Eublepharis macularius]|uniref:7-alpha-hydroxycholest-4-en-3-one 12-alpha-hydroxylase-like n=1 Tax=Eublepharis macularius TaxID=481883 RepID=A0AA97K2F6_EUBMA|nr:7-alpha-hydroxycholest-4-en-3-one 12-alpha-hydroxylase-like [Eublepharis macularius]
MHFWESVLCALLASLFSAILGGLYLAGAFRKRRHKEPPLDKGLIPWLGHGLNFKKNTVEFLEKMQKKHGDIFTVLVGGNYLNFVMNPHTYGTIIKKSKDRLDFNTFGSTIVFNVFGFHPRKSYHKVKETINKKYLRGKNLADLNQVMMENLKTVIFCGLGSGDRERPWQQDGVLHFSYKAMFQASFMTLFGTDPPQSGVSKETSKDHTTTQCGEWFEDFQKFDKYLPQMVSGIMDPLSKKEMERLRNFFWDVLSVKKLSQKDNISNWIAKVDQQMSKAGMAEKMRNQFMFTLFWASQANIGPATFWLFVHLLKHPEVMKAVKEEVDRILKETDQEVKPGSPLINVSLETIKTPLLDSAIQETLRMRVSSFLFRSIMEDMDLTMADGREYSLWKGDQLILFPFIGLHMDPEIYPDPQTFKYDRFLNPDGMKKEFYKNGEKLNYYSMQWGGGGPSMCPGRFFAVSEMKMFVMLMVTYFDMELVNKEENIPPVDASHCGIGIAHPSHDIQFRYRQRI